MYDSVTWEAIPTNAEVVAGYVDGRFRWPDEAWARFPNSVKVRIAVFATTNDGDVLDCENGDATPAQCPDWIRMRQTAGLAKPTIYVNRSQRTAVESACSGLNYSLWIATLDGTTAIDGSVAVQYAGSSLSGGNYDLSVIQDSSWPSSIHGDVDMTPDQDAKLNRIVDVVNRLFDDLEYAVVVADPPFSSPKAEVVLLAREVKELSRQVERGLFENSDPTLGVPKLYSDLAAKLDAIQTRVNAINTPPAVDVAVLAAALRGPLVTALQPFMTDPHAVAEATLADLASKLSPPASGTH
jgi:hypothetical protein